MHPFLKIKEERFNLNSNNNLSKVEIESNYSSVSRDQILLKTGIEDIKSLDRVLAFRHRAYSIVQRSQYKKLLNLILGNSDIIPPEVDKIPEIFENKLLY